MGTHRVEECLQVGKYIGLCLDAGMVMLEMDQVTFEAAEEIFSHGVVIGIAPFFQIGRASCRERV